MKNNKPTRKEAIETQCWHCMGFFADGKQDCECVGCPLYHFMPYRKLQPTNSLFDFNPRRVGKVTWEDSKREMSEEQRKELSDRMRNLKKDCDGE